MQIVRLVLQVALRSLLSRRTNLILAALVCGGTVVAIVGGAVIESMARAMGSSVIRTVGGHLQLYASNSRDPLALFGGLSGASELEQIPSFARVEEVVAGVPGVRAVVPMALMQVGTYAGNPFDVALERVREAYSLHPDQPQRLEPLLAHLRQMLTLLQRDLQATQTFAERDALPGGAMEALARALSPQFWEEFARQPTAGLEFLENRIAPLSDEPRDGALTFIATSLPVFSAHFPQLKVIQGQPVPEGERGCLLSEYIYDLQFKLKTAYNLDRIRHAREQGRTLETDQELQLLLLEAQDHGFEIELQLDPAASATAVQRLRASLGQPEAELPALLDALLAITDANFDQRYQLFYQQLAPLLELYSLKVGEDLIVKSNNRAGEARSTRLKLHGIFHFQGMEAAWPAVEINLMDLASFRILNALDGSASAAPVSGTTPSSGQSDEERRQAEEAMFAAAGELEQAVESQALEDPIFDRGAAEPRFTDRELREGPVLNAAILLEEDSGLDSARAEVQQALDRAGLAVRVLTWREAAGVIGDIISVAWFVLYFVMGMVFVVALTVINNVLVLSVLQRTREIGTLRAIGSQRWLVVLMVTSEAWLLGALAGGLGVGIATVLMGQLSRVGIPAGSDEMIFFFAGPRLFPQLGAVQVVAALAVVAVATTVSSLFPAAMASKVSPLRAMQEGN